MKASPSLVSQLFSLSVHSRRKQINLLWRAKWAVCSLTRWRSSSTPCSTSCWTEWRARSRTGTKSSPNSPPRWTARWKWFRQGGAQRRGFERDGVWLCGLAAVEQDWVGLCEEAAGRSLEEYQWEAEGSGSAGARWRCGLKKVRTNVTLTLKLVEERVCGCAASLSVSEVKC